MICFSVIIPVYNAENYLHQCIESIISQTFKDWEMILVNDGSTDGSLTICQEYASKDIRIKVIDKPNGGPSSARNKGLDEAQGTYVFFVDADDWIEKDSLSLFSQNTQRKPYDIVFHGFICEYSDGRKKKSFTMDVDTTILSKEDIIYKLYKENVYGWSCCKIYKREIIEKYHLRFDETLRLWEDELFTTCFLKYSETIKTVNYHLYHYIFHDDSLMHTGNTYLKRLFLMERMNEALKPIANEELWEYVNSTYNKNLKYSLLMALKNEQDHHCDNQMKRTLLDRYYTRCKIYPDLRTYNVLGGKLSCYVAEVILQTRWKWFIINVLSHA